MQGRVGEKQLKRKKPTAEPACLYPLEEEKISDSPRRSKAFKQAMVVSMAVYRRIIISSDVRLARSRPSMVGAIPFSGSIRHYISYSDELQLALRVSVVLERSKRGAKERRISRCGWIRWSKSPGLQLVGWLTRG